MRSSANAFLSAQRPKTLEDQTAQSHVLDSKDAPRRSTTDPLASLAKCTQVENSTFRISEVDDKSDKPSGSCAPALVRARISDIDDSGNCPRTLFPDNSALLDSPELSGKNQLAEALDTGVKSAELSCETTGMYDRLSADPAINNIISDLKRKIDQKNMVIFHKDQEIEEYVQKEDERTRKERDILRHFANYVEKESLCNKLLQKYGEIIDRMTKWHNKIVRNSTNSSMKSSIVRWKLASRKNRRQKTLELFFEKKITTYVLNRFFSAWNYNARTSSRIKDLEKKAALKGEMKRSKRRFFMFWRFFIANGKRQKLFKWNTIVLFTQKKLRNVLTTWASNARMVKSHRLFHVRKTQKIRRMELSSSLLAWKKACRSVNISRWMHCFMQRATVFRFISVRFHGWVRAAKNNRCVSDKSTTPRQSHDDSDIQGDVTTSDINSSVMERARELYELWDDPDNFNLLDFFDDRKYRDRADSQEDTTEMKTFIRHATNSIKDTNLHLDFQGFDLVDDKEMIFFEDHFEYLTNGCVRPYRSLPLAVYCFYCSKFISGNSDSANYMNRMRFRENCRHDIDSMEPNTRRVSIYEEAKDLNGRSSLCEYNEDLSHQSPDQRFVGRKVHVDFHQQIAGVRQSNENRHQSSRFLKFNDDLVQGVTYDRGLSGNQRHGMEVASRQRPRNDHLFLSYEPSRRVSNDGGGHYV